MRPIIRILLRAGINYKQFAKITREVFVDVASEDFGISGRKTNISRVAILTGISRSEVTKIRKKQEECGEIEIPQTVNNAGRLLSGWHVDKEFLDQNGKPLILTVDGDEPNFTSLMNKYGGDIPATAMLKELKQVSAIAINDSGEIKVLQRYFMPMNYDENRIFSLIDDFVDLGNTAHHNFTRDIDGESRFQVKVTNDYVSLAALPEFKVMVEEKCTALLEDFDDWLAEREIDPSTAIAEKQQIKLGLGMYFIQENK
ncbi:MAG: hypothetical protein HKN88_06400 [Gammaproteobacteria bacterium]|nr:hypothetical protein [Gammaproteobacteria bacterium]NNC97687.1 hypothetical protein [Gammaproteobacteria bacterium]NNM12863.1 hypothetical protein [Gammaproteobacteria bacterium]